MKKPFILVLIAVIVSAVYAQSALTSMARIRGGVFKMGSPVTDKDRDIGEGPQHQVMVSHFSIGKYPVTQREYQIVMGVNPSHFKGDNLPVEQVSWYDAIEYCNALSRREGLTPAYTIDKTRNDPNNKNGDYDNLRWIVTWNRNANGYRLPTEAEWEYACRAGTTASYYGNSSINALGWYLGNSAGRTQAPGEKEPNRFGLYDMLGNVWEWCWDWHGSYSNNEQTDPIGAPSGFYRVFRGANWRSSYSEVRSAIRGRGTPSEVDNVLGFRIAQNAPMSKYK